MESDEFFTLLLIRNLRKDPPEQNSVIMWSFPKISIYKVGCSVSLWVAVCTSQAKGKTYICFLQCNAVNFNFSTKYFENVQYTTACFIVVESLGGRSPG